MPIPVVDIGGEDRGVIVRQIGEACRDFGFFQVSDLMFSLFDANCSVSACDVKCSVLDFVLLIGDQPWDWKGINRADYGGGKGVLSHAD